MLIKPKKKKKGKEKKGVGIMRGMKNSNNTLICEEWQLQKKKNKYLDSSGCLDPLRGSCLQLFLKNLLDLS
jgi:hypothetical protein